MIKRMVTDYNDKREKRCESITYIQMKDGTRLFERRNKTFPFKQKETIDKDYLLKLRYQYELYIH